MASSFEMEPQSTRTRAAATGTIRAASAATAPPAPPTVDHYTASLLTTGHALLHAALAPTAESSEKGLGAAAVTVSTMEQAESVNTATLET